MTYDYNNGELKVYLDEELDVKSCKVLRGIIDGYIMKYQPKELVMDLTKVDFMDSSGIGLILGRYNLLKLLGASMKVINVKQNIKRIIELSKIDMECVKYE